MVITSGAVTIIEHVRPLAQGRSSVYLRDWSPLLET